MGNRLESIYQNIPISKELISATTEVHSVDIGSYEGPFSIQIVWEEGISVNMALSLEVSNDNRHWVAYPGSSQAISTTSSSHMYDISESGVEYIRVVITVIGGSAKFTVLYNGKGRS